MVNLHSTDNGSGLFQNHPEYFQHFKGQLIAASEIKQHTFAEQRVAIIGTNQHTELPSNRFVRSLNRSMFFKMRHNLSCRKRNAEFNA